jgi:tRNA pseudouridine13 synthase
VKPFLRQLAVHSLQSAVFNVALGHRIQEGLWSEVAVGDVIEDLKLGVPSVVLDAEREQARLDAGRVGVLGPLVGPKMRRAKGAAAKGEQRAMEAVGLTPAMLGVLARWAPGDRRLYKLRVEALTLEWDQGDPVLTFELPPGGYATALLNELLVGP